MDAQLAVTSFLVGASFTLADIALLAYTRVAHQGGFDLTAYPAIWRWIAACEGRLKLPRA